MFVNNKRLKLPSSITLNGVQVQVVQPFQLLEVYIDNKLSFVSSMFEYNLIKNNLYQKSFLLIL